MLAHAQVEQLLAAEGLAVNRVTLYSLLHRFVAGGLLRRLRDWRRATESLVNFWTSKLACNPYPASASSYKKNSVFVAQRTDHAKSGMRCLLGLLLSAVIFAQMLGLMHQLVHAPHEQSLPVAELQHQHQAEAGVHGSAWLETLFASHDEGASSCRVFDQQGHSAPMTAVASLDLPGVFRAQVPTEGTACHLAVAAAPFQARAPPFLR